MRIVGGTWRGRALSPPGKGDEAARLRPTSDRVRESIFNLLVNGAQAGRLPGARVLDLFAGTGALGLEALSRGAAEALLVDDGAVAGRLIARNIALVGAGERARLLPRDATRLGPLGGRPFDLVFLDPPYGRGLGLRALEAARAGGWLSPGALIVWEEGSPPEPPAWTSLLDRRRYGGTHLALLDAGA